MIKVVVEGSLMKASVHRDHVTTKRLKKAFVCL